MGNPSEILSEIHTFSFNRMHLKIMAAILSQPQCVNWSFNTTNHTHSAILNAIPRNDGHKTKPNS